MLSKFGLRVFIYMSPLRLALMCAYMIGCLLLGGQEYHIWDSGLMKGVLVFLSLTRK
jgi:hypothetical protein